MERVSMGWKVEKSTATGIINWKVTDRKFIDSKTCPDIILFRGQKKRNKKLKLRLGSQK